MPEFDKIVVITKKTALEELVERAMIDLRQRHTLGPRTAYLEARAERVGDQRAHHDQSQQPAGDPENLAPHQGLRVKQ